MPTNFTDPTLSSSVYIRALHINELRSVVDQNRIAAGLGRYPWTDYPATTSTHIRAVHFTEPRSAIQDLWNHAGMGPLPNWSFGSAPAGGGTRPISARDTTDLRTWIQQYENVTGISYQPIPPVIGPLRGLHLRNADLRSGAADTSAINLLQPGMIVLLLGSWDGSTWSPGSLPNTVSFLQGYLATYPNTEVFVRIFPTFCPPVNPPQYPLDYSNSDPRFPLVISRSPSQAAAAVTAAYDYFSGNGLGITRYDVGNEPEIEWNSNLTDPRNQLPSDQWNAMKWQDIGSYFGDVWSAVQSQKGTRTIELYPPAFNQYAPFGVGQYCYNGSTHAKALSDGTATGFDKVRTMLESYYRRVNWHSYFCPGYQAQQSAFQFMPAWLRQHIAADGWPARITEFGWHHSCFPGNSQDDSACPAASPCNANLDTRTTSCDGALPGLSAAANYNDFVRNRSGAGGAAVWLLSSSDPAFANWVAVSEGSTTPRAWFQQYVAALNTSS